MNKKFFLLHKPASLRGVGANSTLLIEYSQYDPVLDKVVRIRKTHGLNVIKSKKLQVKRAKEIINFINSQLPFGYPFVQISKFDDNPLVHTPILEALKRVYDIKILSDRRNTRRTINSTWNVFTGWLNREGYDSFTISQFQPRHAKQYMDYALVERKVGNNTYNNYLTCVNLFFNELVRGDYIDKNPFRKILRKKKNQDSVECLLSRMTILLLSSATCRVSELTLLYSSSSFSLSRLFSSVSDLSITSKSILFSFFRFKRNLNKLGMRLPTRAEIAATIIVVKSMRGII